MNPGFLDKLMERLDRLDTGNLQAQFLRLAHDRGLLETIFHAIQEGLVVLDGEGRIEYANRAAEKMFGFRADDARGQLIRRFIREIEWDLVLDLDGDEWTKLVSREIEITYPERRFIDFYVVPLAAVRPKETGAVVILRDITRERENEAKSIESERLNALTLLAAGVAHEIGNPLNSLTIHLQLLQRELASLSESQAAPLRELVEVSQREVTRLDQILSQFLRAVRPTRPGFERCALPPVLNDTIAFLQHEIRDRNILVEIDQPEGLPEAMVDRNQVKQAFFNIIRNAIQAMPQGGVLKVLFRSNDRFVSIAFKDSGPGIPADQIGSLFEPYFTTKPEGNGLGLMIVQRIVRDHGGELEVHSEPGIGTTFTLFFPRDERRIRLLAARKPDEKTEPVPTATPRRRKTDRSEPS